MGHTLAQKANSIAGAHDVGFVRALAASDPATRASSMLDLQRSLGNAALTQLVSGVSDQRLSVQRFPLGEALKRRMGGEAGSPEGAEGPEHAISGMAFKRTFELPTGETEGVAFGPVKLFGHGKVTLNGSINHGKGGQLNVGAKGGEGFSEGEFEKEYETKYGKVKVGGSAEPGKTSALSVGFGGETYEIHFQAHANLKAPFSVGFEVKPHHTELHMGDWKFAGEISAGIEIDIGPNPIWWAEHAAEVAAEEAAGEVVAEAAGEGVSGVALETGEQGLVAGAGSAALVGVGVAAAGVAWTGLVLYEIGNANQQGERRAVQKRYCNGYARVLSMMTEPLDAAHPVRAYNKGQEAQLTWALHTNWSHQMEVAEKTYLAADDAKGRDEAGYRAEMAGKARATQEAMAYVDENGAEAWQDVIAEHIKRYGGSRQERQDAYTRILYRQGGDELPFIPIP